MHHRITHVKRSTESWLVTVMEVKTGRQFKRHYDAVMLCNGRYSQPKYPDIPGLDSFSGQLIHSHDYREPKPFAGQTVLVLGAGPSGIDISLEVSQTADRVYLVHQLADLFVDLPSNI